MIAVVVLAAVLLTDAPSYSAGSIVNSASNVPGALAPNTFVTIYGSGLAFATRSLQSSDLLGNQLPTVLGNTGVRVFINNIPAFIYYVSPTQINALIPTIMAPGPGALQIARDSLWGPRIPITLTTAAPALFLSDATTAIALHPDGTLITGTSPGAPLENIVLYASGLGSTVPQPDYAEIPMKAAPLQNMAGFQILFDGVPVENSRIYYAGVAPGFAGLFQINVQLPDWVGANPQVRLVAGGQTSPAGVMIPVTLGAGSTSALKQEHGR